MSNWNTGIGGSGSGGVGPAGPGTNSILIYQPGGVQQNNVYSSWSDLLTVFDANPGIIEIIVDDTIVTPAVLDTSHDFEQRVIISGLNQNTQITSSAGVTLLGVSEIKDCSITANTTTSVFLDGSPSYYGGYLLVIFSQNAALSASSSNFPAVKITSNTNYGAFIIQNNSSFIGANSVLDINGLNAIIYSSFGGFGTDTIKGNGILYAYTDNFSNIGIQSTFTGTIQAGSPNIYNNYLKNYFKGDTVTYNNHPYQAIQQVAGQLPSNASYWKPVQGNTLIFQPGGTAYGNVYNTWSSLLSVFDNTPGTVTIVLDGSLNSNSVTLDTSHNFQNRVNFISSANYGTSTTILTVNTSAGVQLQGVSEINGGYWICNTTTTSCFTPPTSGYLFMTIKGGAYIYSSSTNNAAIKPTTAGQLILDNGFLGDYNYVGTNPVLNTNGVDMYIICSSGGGFGGYYVFTGTGIIDIFYTDLASYQFSNQASFTGYSGTIYVSQPITTWTGNASYNVNTITSYGGILYKSLIAGSNKRPDLNPTYWETISKTHISVDLLASSNVTLSGEQTIDGVLTSASRVFVPYQTSAATRGIYLTGSGAWTRVTDYDTAAKLEANRNIIVKSGTNFSGTIWTLQTPNGLTLGSTSLYYSLVKTGSGNVNMALGSLVVSGESNTISSTSQSSIIGGGTFNSITGSTYAVIVGGVRNTVSSTSIASGILAGIGGNTYLQTQIVHGGGYTSAIGDVQHSRLILRGSTAGSAENESSSILFGVAAGVPTQSMTLANGKSYSIRAIVNITKTGDPSISGSIFVDASVYKSGNVVVVLGQTPTSPVALPAGLTGATAVFSGSTTNLVLTVSTGVGNTIATKIGATVEWLENIA